MNSSELQEAYGGFKTLQVQSERTPFEQVLEFHEVFGHPVSTKPHFISEDRLELRMNLIEEEWNEVTEAVDNKDLSNLAKELADLVYVINGFAIESGIDLDEVFEEVHRSNMSKLDENGKPIYREDGKVLKGKNFSPADIESVLGL